MGVELAHFQSKSKPGKYYRILEPDGGGQPYCECWQWKQNRTCSHLKAYHANVGNCYTPAIMPIIKAVQGMIGDHESNVMRDILFK